MALTKVTETISSNPVVLFSKTWCKYCKEVKDLFTELNVTYKLYELDEESDGGEVQSALKDLTGQSSVPSVFIGGKHIGGSYDALEKHRSEQHTAIMEKHKAGQLVPLLTEAGAIGNNSAQHSSR